MEFGVFIAGHWLDRSKPAKQLFDEMLAEAVLAEQLGFDMVWLAEHYIIDYITLPDPLAFATAIFERTERIKAGVAVLILRNHHPMRLAAQMAQADVLYGGRWACAFGRGSSGYELRQMGLELSPEDSRDYFHEHVLVMARLWRSRRSIAFHGRFFDFDSAAIMPPPVTPDPPFWLAALSPFAVRLGVQHCVEADIPVRLISSPFREPWPYIAERYGAFEAALKEFGVARKDARYAVNRIAYVAETDEKAREVLPWVLAIHRGLDRLLADSEIVVDGHVVTDPVPNEPSPEEMFENCLIGSPETVRRKLRVYADAGIDHVSAYMHLGQPHAMVARSMELYANEVLPEFR